MSGVWVFKNNGVMHLASTAAPPSQGRRKVLVHAATEEVVSSYEVLDGVLRSLGWERYGGGGGGGGGGGFFQYHKTTSIDLISLPLDFAKFNSIHMYDIVVKNPNVFLVRQI